MTVLDVFDIAMHLTDNGDESSSNNAPRNITDNIEYKNRILSVVNNLINELYPYSSTYDNSGTGRPVLELLTSLDDEINLDLFCAATVLPCGIAARLFVDENGTQANYFQQEYERYLNMLRSGFGMLAEASTIEDAYGGGYTDDSGVYHSYYPHSEFGYWA